MVPYLSVVIPVYNEEDNLRPLFIRLINALEAIDKPFEIIFTNDGSQDKSQEILQELHGQRPNEVRIIEFNGNFGQHMAIMAAFAQVSGEVIITLDADLQNPPEEIHKLLTAINKGHDVVGAYRKDRQDSLFRRYASRLNNYIRYKITRIRMTDQGCMLRAYHRSVIDLIVATDEKAAFIPALAYSLAANPTEVEVEHDMRAAGESKYNLYSLLRLNFDLMTGFSLIPLQIFTVFGFFVSLFSTLFVAYLFIRRLMMGPEAEGLFTLFAILFFLIGVLLMGLGIVGEYIGRIYQTSNKRPNYVIRKIWEK